MISLCVFCGSSNGMHPRYLEVAAELGALFAESGVQLVYGGGNVGLMGAVAQGCMSAGGRVIGIIPKALFDKEHGSREITRLEVVDTMHERKARMASLADGFIALPGGMGTFEELFEVLTWSQLGIHCKPVGLVNTGKFYDPLLTLLRHANQEGFIQQRHLDLLLTAETARDVLTLMISRLPASALPVSDLGI